MGPKMRGGPSVPPAVCGFSAALGFLAWIVLWLVIWAGALEYLRGL